MNAFTAAKGSFTAAKGRELQSVDGLGFRPFAVVAWWAQQSKAGASRGNRGGIGFWTEAESASMAWASEDGAASTRTARIADDSALLGLNEAGAQVAMRAGVESFDEDGLTLGYGTAPAEDWVVHFLAFGGMAVPGGRVGWISSADVAAITGPEHSDVVLLLPVPAELGVISRNLIVALGAAGRRGAAVAGYICPDDARPGEVTGVQRHGAAVFDWPGEDESRLCHLLLDGVRAKVGIDVSPAGPGSRRTRVGFRPEALLLFSWGLSASADVRTIGRLCIGGWASGRTGCISWDDRNVEARETSTHARSSTEHGLVVSDTRTGRVHAEATLTAVDERGFTLDWSNDGGHREFAYVALSGRDTRGRASRAVDRISRLLRR